LIPIGITTGEIVLSLGLLAIGRYVLLTDFAAEQSDLHTSHIFHNILYSLCLSNRKFIVGWTLTTSLSR